MTILHIVASSHSDTLLLTISDESLPAFRELIQRGANLWPDAPPEIKQLADLVTSGQVMQDYTSQAQKPRPE